MYQKKIRQVNSSKGVSPRNNLFFYIVGNLAKSKVKRKVKDTFTSEDKLSKELKCSPMLFIESLLEFLLAWLIPPYPMDMVEFALQEYMDIIHVCLECKYSCSDLSYYRGFLRSDLDPVRLVVS